MLGMDTPMLDIDPSEESRERLPLIYHQLVKNHSGCAQRSSAYIEKFLSILISIACTHRADKQYASSRQSYLSMQGWCYRYSQYSHGHTTFLAEQFNFSWVCCISKLMLSQARLWVTIRLYQGIIPFAHNFILFLVIFTCVLVGAIVES